MGEEGQRDRCDPKQEHRSEQACYPAVAVGEGMYGDERVVRESRLNSRVSPRELGSVDLSDEPANLVRHSRHRSRRVERPVGSLYVVGLDLVLAPGKLNVLAHPLAAHEHSGLVCLLESCRQGVQGANGCFAELGGAGREIEREVIGLQRGVDMSDGFLPGLDRDCLPPRVVGDDRDSDPLVGWVEPLERPGM